MPTYQYHCDPDEKGCNHLIEVACSYSDKEAKKPKSCPNCRKKKPLYEVFSGGTDVFIHNTLGVMADKNSSKLSVDEKTHLGQRHTDYKRKTNSEGNWVQTPDGLKHQSQMRK